MKCDCKECAFRGMELCEQRKLFDENAKLKEALKPIMEFHAAPAKWLNMDEMYHASFDAVRKAQDIMNGIIKKENEVSGNEMGKYRVAFRFKGGSKYRFAHGDAFIMKDVAIAMANAMIHEKPFDRAVFFGSKENGWELVWEKTIGKGDK